MICLTMPCDLFVANTLKLTCRVSLSVLREKQLLAVAEAKGIAQQTQPLIQAELDEQSKGFPRFRTEPNVSGQRLRLSKALTALEVAAGLGDENVFGLVRDAEADESAWLSTSEASRADFDDTKLSVISTSSPHTCELRKTV